MATPTVSSVTPDSGHFIGGFRIELIGTGFIPPSDAFGFDYDPADTGEIFQKVPANIPPFPTPAPIDRMQIQIDIGGNVTTVGRVHVASITKMWFLMPRIRASANSTRSQQYTELGDLIITPLDALGDPIIGDQLTLTDALTLGIPQTGRSSSEDFASVHKIVTEKLILDLRSFVLANTKAIPWLDFEKSTALLRDSSKLPALVICGPEVQRSIFGTKKFRVVKVQADPTTVNLLRNAEARDLVFDIFVLDDSHGHLLDAQNLLEAYVLRTQYFSYTLFPSATHPFEVTSTMMFERYPSIDDVPSLLPSSVRQLRARIRIAGVPVGLYANLKDEVVLNVVTVVNSDIIHGVADPADEENPTVPPGIIED